MVLLRKEATHKLYVTRALTYKCYVTRGGSYRDDAKHYVLRILYLSRSEFMRRCSGERAILSAPKL